jgi:hypothetical protein
LTLPKFSLRTAILAMLFCGVAVSVFSWLEPVYYRAKWRSSGGSALGDAKFLKRLLAMGPVGWRIATDETVAEDPETRGRSGAYCINVSQGMSEGSELFWRIWAQRCIHDEEFLRQFLSRNMDLIPAIVATLNEHALPETLEDINPVYIKYRKEFLSALNSEQMSPLNPPELIQRTVEIVKSAGVVLAPRPAL